MFHSQRKDFKKVWKLKWARCRWLAATGQYQVHFTDKKKEGKLFETVSSYLCQYYTIFWVKFPKTMFALFQDILSHHDIVQYKPIIFLELWLKQAWKHHQQIKEQVKVV